MNDLEDLIKSVDEKTAAQQDILPETPFNEDRHPYIVGVDNDGVYVYSECCGNTMSRETAILLRDAITVWLNRTEA